MVLYAKKPMPTYNPKLATAGSEGDFHSETCRKAFKGLRKATEEQAICAWWRADSKCKDAASAIMAAAAVWSYTKLAVLYASAACVESKLIPML